MNLNEVIEVKTIRLKRIIRNFVKYLITYKNFHLLALSYTKLLKKDKLTLKLWNGIKMNVRPKTIDSGVVSGVWIYDDYWLKKFNIKEKDIIIDMGANIGAYSIFFASKKARVFSFEPVLDNYNCLKENIKMNNLKNVKAFKEAVCGEKGKRRIYISPCSTGHHGLYAHTDKYETVECTTLKDILKKNHIKECKLVKIDVEGAEYEILLNTPLKYLKKIKNITMEYHSINGYSIGDLTKFLRNAGFDIIIRKEKWKKFMLARNIAKGDFLRSTTA